MYRTQIIRSLDSWRATAASWDALGHRAQHHFPMHQSGSLEAVVSHFFDPQAFAAIGVWRGEQLVAGLPLLARRRAVMAPTAKTVANDWAPRGCLLVDPQADLTEVSQGLLAGLRELGLWYAQLDWLDLDQPQLRSLIQQWGSSGLGCWVKPRFLVGRIDVPRCWNDYLATWSRNRRKKTAQWERQLERQGAVALEAIDSRDPARAWEGLHAALAIEHEGWKGAAGTSVHAHSQARQFVEDWARYHLDHGSFRLYLLTLSGRPIAFDLGTTLQRVFTSYKISYLPEWAEASPGQYLLYRQLQHFSEKQEVDWIDCVGELSEPVARWSTGSFTVGKIVLSTGSWLGNQTVSWMAGLSAARAQWKRTSTVSAFDGSP